MTRFGRKLESDNVRIFCHSNVFDKAFNVVTKLGVINFNNRILDALRDDRLVGFSGAKHEDPC